MNCMEFNTFRELLIKQISKQFNRPISHIKLGDPLFADNVLNNTTLKEIKVAYIQMGTQLEQITIALPYIEYNRTLVFLDTSSDLENPIIDSYLFNKGGNFNGKQKDYKHRKEI